MKRGDVVFFREARTSNGRKGQGFRFKGNGFGILLGALPPFQKDPTRGDILRALGSMGFVSFDDVGEFLGPEIGGDLLKKFEAAYYTPDPVPDDQQSLPLEGEAAAALESPPPPPSPGPTLVGLDGQPLPPSTPRPGVEL